MPEQSKYPQPSSSPSSRKTSNLVLWWGQAEQLPPNLGAKTCQLEQLLSLSNNSGDDSVILAHSPLPTAYTQALATQRAAPAVPAMPELFGQQLANAKLIVGLEPLSSLTVLMLEPLIRQGVLLPKTLQAKAYLPPQLETSPELEELSEAQEVLSGNFAIDLQTQSQSQPTSLIKLLLTVWLPDGWSERDVWAAYREFYADQDSILLNYGSEMTEEALADDTNLTFKVSLHLGQLAADSGKLQLTGFIDWQGRSRAQSLRLAYLEHAATNKPTTKPV